jgi:hypothetical protein
MRLRGLVLWTAMVVAGSAQSALPQEPPPAQPLAEVQVAQEFKKAAPVLFAEWVARRPEALRRQGLGQREQGGARCGVGITYFVFMDCADVQSPTDYRIDVTKTDSVLTPFLGHLYVPVKETCTVRNVVPKGMSWSEKAMAALDPSWQNLR